MSKANWRETCVDRARSLEDRLNGMIDAQRRGEAMRSNMSEDDQIAISIVCLEAQPDDVHTREWAYSRVRKIAKHRIMGLIARKVMECGDIGEAMALVPYLAPKPEQEVVLSGDKDRPVAVDMDVTARVMTPGEFFGEVFLAFQDTTRGLPGTGERFNSTHDGGAS